VTEAAALLARLAGVAGTRRGRFRLLHLPDEGAACLPVSLNSARVSAASLLRVALPRLDGAGQGAALRVAVALRQRAWRHLRGRRGLLPVTVVETRPGAATLLACWLDGAAASPAPLDVLTKIFDDAALRQDLAWATRAGAGRTMPRPPRPQANEGQ
jgi:hypothetical protein